MGDQAAADVLSEVVGGVGRIVLNRPSSLNAISKGMIDTLFDVLSSWRDDPAVRTVLLEGAGDRAFCAGGDLRGDSREKSEGSSSTEAFLSQEYRLDDLIATYPKPLVTLMHGIVLGGGVGLGCHAPIRVVLDDARVGMPETRIGIVPDAGGSLLLARAPGLVGIHLGLTSGSMTADEAVRYGFADYVVPKERREALTHALLSEGSDPVKAVRSFARPSNAPPPAAWIEEAYSADSVEEIVVRLEKLGPEAQAARVRLLEMCPTAVVVTLRVLREAARMNDLRASLRLEYLVMLALSRRPDAKEGIRARLIDRDTPRWSPARLEDVDLHEVETILSGADRFEFELESRL